jgi:xylan 1,4-beta-xylosidase
VGGASPGLQRASRYGRREVRDNWAFEVWNEPNLRSFWAGSFDDYVEFYDATARAVKRADGRLRVGGPATAAAGWIDGFLAAVQDSGSPLDFLSTHVYGTLPLDMRPPLDRNGFAGLPQWWTEWGVSPTHFADVNDAVFGAPFSLHGMKSALTRIEALTTWVISDHFEELGRPERLFHGGFGLLTVGNLRKPRFWALAMLERLNEWRLEAGVTGDGAEALVDVLATRGQDGRVSVLIWNGTLAQQRARGDDSLAREIDLRVEGLDAGRYDCRHWRIDDQHSNIVAVWERHDGRAWPDEDGWERLAAADHLDEYEPVRSVQPVAGRATLRFDLPMPGVSLLELVPV